MEFKKIKQDADIMVIAVLLFSLCSLVSPWILEEYKSVLIFAEIASGGLAIVFGVLVITGSLRIILLKMVKREMGLDG